MGPVSTLLAERVTLRLSCLDRLLVQGYVPRLQSEGLLVRWMLDRGEAPSPRVFGRAHERMVDAVARFVKETGVPLVSFGRGQRKEDVARPYQLAAEREGREGVVLVGVAQEKMVGGWRGQRDGGSDAHPHFAFRRAQMYVNHYYFYVWDAQWGPAFVKMCPFVLLTSVGANAAWLGLNVMAHNMARWTSRVGLGESLIATDTLRRRYLRTPGRVTFSARRFTLHLPTRWPWAEPFTTGLANLRAVVLVT